MKRQRPSETYYSLIRECGSFVETATIEYLRHYVQDGYIEFSMQRYSSLDDASNVDEYRVCVACDRNGEFVVNGPSYPQSMVEFEKLSEWFRDNRNSVSMQKSLVEVTFLKRDTYVEMNRRKRPVHAMVYQYFPKLVDKWCTPCELSKHDIIASMSETVQNLHKCSLIHMHVRLGSFVCVDHKTVKLHITKERSLDLNIRHNRQKAAYSAMDYRNRAVSEYEPVLNLIRANRVKVIDMHALYVCQLKLLLMSVPGDFHAREIQRILHDNKCSRELATIECLEYWTRRAQWLFENGTLHALSHRPMFAYFLGEKYLSDQSNRVKWK